MVGQRIAHFVALEIKAAHGVDSPEQRAFMKLLRELGGVALAFSGSPFLSLARTVHKI
jgi:hypothetical protein